MKIIFSIIFLVSSQLCLAESTKSESEWIAEFESGNIEAAYELGVINYEGINRSKNAPAAAVYFNLSANVGVVGAMVYLANMHLTGDGASHDCNRAQAWIEKATGKPIPQGWQESIAQCHKSFNKALKADAK